MLEQRRAQEKGFITLREAADISDYAPDYIGQLIREGKIEGEQVYSTVAWVTTENSVRAYMQAKNKSSHKSLESSNVSEAAENFSIYVLYSTIVTLGIVSLSLFYIFSVTIDKAIEQRVFDSTPREFEVANVVAIHE